MATKSQIKKIHTLKNVLTLEDEVYREMLMSYNVQSSKNLSYFDAVLFIRALEDKAVSLNLWQKQPLKYANLSRDDMATPAQLRMIEGLWRELSYVDNNKYAKKSLRKILKMKLKTDDIMFLTKSQANKAINLIKEMKKNVQKSV